MSEMKKLLSLIIAIISITLFVSCEKEEITSLTGTYWTSPRIEHDGGWGQDELVFTSTYATYIRRTDYGSTGGPSTWSYTFDPPTITLERPVIGLDGEYYVQSSTGTVKGNAMYIEIWRTLDVMMELELTKQ